MVSGLVAAMTATDIMQWILIGGSFLVFILHHNDDSIHRRP